MATLEDIQAVEYEMFQFVHDRCKKLGIRYNMVGGTMLGAVRHHGFIPWDDDVDIYMSMDDFEIFKKGFSSDKYFLQTPEKEREFASIVCKLRKNGTVMKTAVKGKLNIHQGIWLDIFVYTDAAKSNLGKKMQVFLRNALQSFRLKFQYKITAPERKLHVLLCYLPFPVSLAIDRFLYRSIRLLGNKTSEEYFALDVCKRMFFKKSYFDRTRLYQFEGGEFWGIEEYDEYLSDFYGPDYMTPKKWGHVEDYSEVIV